MRCARAAYARSGTRMSLYAATYVRRPIDALTTVVGMKRPNRRQGEDVSEESERRGPDPSTRLIQARNPTLHGRQRPRRVASRLTPRPGSLCTFLHSSSKQTRLPLGLVARLVEKNAPEFVERTILECGSD